MKKLLKLTYFYLKVLQFTLDQIGINLLKFKNLLMKQAAAKEISMLLPVVFVVLPSVLVVAMYPAITVLQKLG